MELPKRLLRTFTSSCARFLHVSRQFRELALKVFSLQIKTLVQKCPIYINPNLDTIYSCNFILNGRCRYLTRRTWRCQMENWIAYGEDAMRYIEWAEVSSYLWVTLWNSDYLRCGWKSVSARRYCLYLQTHPFGHSKAYAYYDLTRLRELNRVPKVKPNRKLPTTSQRLSHPSTNSLAFPSNFASRSGVSLLAIKSSR